MGRDVAAKAKIYGKNDNYVDLREWIRDGYEVETFGAHIDEDGIPSVRLTDWMLAEIAAADLGLSSRRRWVMCALWEVANVSKEPETDEAVQAV